MSTTTTTTTTTTNFDNFHISYYASTDDSEKAICFICKMIPKISKEIISIIVGLCKALPVFSTVGSSLRSVPIIDSWKSFAMINTSSSIPLDGMITQWKWYGKTDKKKGKTENGKTKVAIFLQVYRLKERISFELVGESRAYETLKGKVNTLTLDDDAQISVKKGDLIGWTFVGEAAVGYASPSFENPSFVRWGPSSRSDGPHKVGQLWKFQGAGLRTYPIQATITSDRKSPIVVGNLLGPTTSHDRWKEFPMVDTLNIIPFDGVITEWKFFGKSTDGIYLQIYRLVRNSEFKLIGETHVDTTLNGQINTISLLDFDRISVRQGDLIGCTFKKNPAMGFNETGFVRWGSESGIGGPHTCGAICKFPNPGNRKYPIQAVICEV